MRFKKISECQIGHLVRAQAVFHRESNQPRLSFYTEDDKSICGELNILGARVSHNTWLKRLKR